MVDICSTVQKITGTLLILRECGLRAEYMYILWPAGYSLICIYKLLGVSKSAHINDNKKAKNLSQLPALPSLSSLCHHCAFCSYALPCLISITVQFSKSSAEWEMVEVEGLKRGFKSGNMFCSVLGPAWWNAVLAAVMLAEKDDLCNCLPLKVEQGNCEWLWGGQRAETIQTRRRMDLELVNRRQPYVLQITVI